MLFLAFRANWLIEELYGSVVNSGGTAVTIAIIVIIVILICYFLESKYHERPGYNLNFYKIESSPSKRTEKIPHRRLVPAQELLLNRCSGQGQENCRSFEKEQVSCRCLVQLGEQEQGLQLHKCFGLGLGSRRNLGQQQVSCKS